MSEKTEWPDASDQSISWTSLWIQSCRTVMVFFYPLDFILLGRVVISDFFMPLDWSPPSLWTDAPGLSVDASGLVPPHPPPSGSSRGGMGGDHLHAATKCLCIAK